WLGRAALLCSSALYGSLICERPGPWYRRAVFTGHDLDVAGSPCQCASDGQGAILAPIRRGRQSHTLGSIDEHEYRGYADRRKPFLCGPFISGQWTALRRWWTHRQLCGAA